MQLTIQTPCYNKTETLTFTICDLQRTLTDLDAIEYLANDNVSTDLTAEGARQVSVNHNIYLSKDCWASSLLASKFA